MALSVVFFVLMFTAALQMWRKNNYPKKNNTHCVLRLLAGITLTGFAGYELFTVLSRPFLLFKPQDWLKNNAGLLYAFFTLLAGIMICLPAVMDLRGRKGRQFGFAYIIPVFWGCFRLISTFFLHSSNPVAKSFAYDLFADVAILLALYYFAGYYFAHRRPVMLRLTGGLAVYFGTIGLLSPLLFRLLPVTLSTSPFAVKLANQPLSALPYAGFIKEFTTQAYAVNLGVFAFCVLFGLSLLIADIRYGPKDELTAEADGETAFPAVPDEDAPLDMSDIEITMIGLCLRDESDAEIVKMDEDVAAPVEPVAPANTDEQDSGLRDGWV